MKKKYVMDRFVSLCYDYIFVFMFIIMISIGLNILNEKFTILGDTSLFIINISLNILFYLFVYTFISYKLNGSIGKYLNDFYVEPTEGKLTFGRVLFREVVMKQLLYLTVIGFIYEIIFFIRKKETLHDYYLKTKVVKKEPPKKEEPEKKSFLFKNK